jgi:excisionase family DNA binding protein
MIGRVIISTSVSDDLRWLTVQQVADRWQVNRRTVERAIEAGKLKARRLPGGGGWRIRPEDADAWGEPDE